MTKRQKKEWSSDFISTEEQLPYISFDELKVRLMSNNGTINIANGGAAGLVVGYALGRYRRP